MSNPLLDDAEASKLRRNAMAGARAAKAYGRLCKDDSWRAIVSANVMLARLINRSAVRQRVKLIKEYAA